MNANIHTTKITTAKFCGNDEYKDYSTLFDDAAAHNHPHWFEGVPVTRALKDFLQEFKAKRYLIVPYLSGDTSWYPSSFHEGRYRVYDGVQIAYHDAPTMPVGSLSISSDAQYCVTSSRIANEKFNARNDGYHQKKSKDLRKAVKNAVTYLRPHTFNDLETKLKHKMSTAIEAVRDPARSKFYKLFNLPMGEVADEVANMLASGYSPATRVFREALDVMATEGAELKRLKDYKPRTCFVWSREAGLSYKYSDSTEVIEINNIGDLPEIDRKSTRLNSSHSSVSRMPSSA